MKLVTRPMWGATVPLGPPMPGPADEVWLHHSVTRATDSRVDDMKAIEAIGKQRFGQFSYSYAYHPPSRSWLVGAGDTIGAHTKGRNSRSLGLVVIGNTNTDSVPYLVDDTAALIQWLIGRGQLKPVAEAHAFPGGPWTEPGYPTGGHRDQKSTACPGDHAYERIGAIRRAVVNRPTEPPKGFLMALSDAEQEDLYQKTKSLYRHLIEGPDPKPNTDRADLTWPQRVIASLRRIEAQD